MWKWTQRTFAGGQQDLTLAGRQDLATYFTSARTLENFLVKRQGCISKRRGTNLVANLDGLFGDGWKIAHARAIPFVFERDGGYVLLFAEGTKEGETGTETKRGMFVCSAGGILLAKTRVLKPDKVEPMVPEPMVGTDRWSNTTLIEEDPDPEGVYLDRYVPKMLEIPYAGEDFNAIGYSQSGDTLFVAHRKYPFARIVRGDSGFVYEPIDFSLQGANNAYFPPTISVSTKGTAGSGGKRTVSYAITYVKDGIESSTSTPAHIEYGLPWGQGFEVVVTSDKGANQDPPDYFTIYKKVGGEYGFIGQTGASKKAVVPSVDMNSLALDMDYGYYSPTRSGITLTPSRWIKSESYLKKFFNGGTTQAYYGSNSVLVGGIRSMNDAAKAVVIPFVAGTAFSDVVLRLGIGVYYDTETFKDGDYWKIYRLYMCKHIEGTTVTVELTVTDGTTTKTYTAAGTITAPTDANKKTYLVYDYSYKPGSNSGGTKYMSPWAVESAVQRAIFNSGETFRTEIEKVFTKGGWWVTQMKISAKNGTTAVPVYVSNAECYYYDKTDTTFYDDNITPDVSLTPPVNEPHFAGDGEYPACVSLYNQRLVLAATENSPFTLWMSTVGDLYNFNTHDSIRDDDAIESTIPATEFPEVNHIVSARELLVLCDNGEWVVKPSSGNALTYRTMEIKQQSQIGCSKRLPPLSVGDEAIFAENTSETLRAIKYSWESDGFVSTDLSVLSQSLTRGNPIIDYAYKQHPDSTIVCVLQDGTIATLTYMKEHEVCAWSTARLGGGLKAVGICTDKAIRGGTTDLYILATDASGVYSLLRVREDSPADTVEESLCLDAMQTVEVAKDATEVPTIPDGMVAYDVADGREVEVLKAGHAYAMGYPYQAIFRSVTPEAQGQNTIQFELKGAKSAELRLENASAFKVIPSALEGESDVNYWTTCGDDVKIVDGKVTYSAQDHFVALAGDTNTSGAITIKSDSPWPMSLLSYSINFEFDPRLLGQNG